jgi:hypothetical protein
MRRAPSGQAAVALFVLIVPAVARAQDPAPAAPAEPPKNPVTVAGFVHADWVVFRQTSQDEVNDDGEPLNENRFVVRRARMRVTSDRGLTFAAAEIDVNTIKGLQVRPINAEATFKWPPSRPGLDPSVDAGKLPIETWFMASAGLIQTPFGFEPQEFAIRRPFLEQTTMSEALFPGQFDLGMRLMGGFKLVNYALGIMNGAPIGDRTFPGRDPNQSKDLTFRLGAASNVTDAVRVEGGFSGLTGRGFHRGRPATNDQVVWRDLNEDGVVDPLELQSLAGAPAEPSQTFKRFALGADVRVTVKIRKLGELHLRGEIVRASNLDRGLFVADPVATTYDQRELGWYVGATQDLTRFAQVGVRYDRYDPDSDAREREPFALVPRDLSMSTWSFMAAARAPFGRLVAQYDHRTNALGRNPAGAPATLADDSFTLRAEARF